MCGIEAVFCNTIPKDLKKIIAGGRYLKTRGPDSSLTIVRKDGIFIFRRLSILDNSSDGTQPMISNKGVIMMCNGEIYNYKELISRYNLKCNSKSDCEVILRLYEKIGDFTETVKQLDGVYAIVLVDGPDMYLARDRIGVRPLYMGLTQERFIAIASHPYCLVSYCTDISPITPGQVLQCSKRLGKFDELKLLHHDKLYIPRVKLENEVKILHDTLYKAVEYYVNCWVVQMFVLILLVWLGQLIYIILEK